MVPGNSIQLHEHITPVPELNLSHLYIGDPIVQRFTDRSQSAVVFRYVDVWMSLKADSTDSRYDDGGTDAERLE